MLNSVPSMLPSPKRRNKESRLDSRELAEFLPSILEIQESPPHPLAKWLARSLIVLFVLTLCWLCIGKVNVVATAEGKIIPTSRIKQIQPFEKGVVKAIYVQEGQIVQQGDPLIELDRTLTESTVASAHSKLKSQKLMLAVNKALADITYTATSADVHLQSALNSDEVSAEDVQLHEHYLEQRRQQYYAQASSFDKEIEEISAQIAVSDELIEKFERILPIVRRRHTNLKGLVENNYISEDDFLQIDQELISKEQDLKAEKHRKIQLEATINKINQKFVSFKAEYNGAIINEVTQLQNSIALLEEELSRASDFDSKRILYAPVTGQVQQLAVNTIGGVVTEAQPLMVIVPSDNLLEAEVMLENKDIGFVMEDMPVEIKIHTFPFTKYGLIEGDVTNISDDAILDEHRGLVYKAKVALKKSYLSVSGRQVDLIPGMSLTAEVKTDERRIIEFFLDPLLKSGSESLRER